MSARWYIIHAYSNFEKKVADDIELKAQQKGLSDRIEQIVVPTEKVVEVRRGRKVDAERKFFPGYVLMKAHLTDEIFSLVKNTVRVSEGPFASFSGVVQEVEVERSRLKVEVSIFGRATPVDLEFGQVEKL